MQIIFMGTPDFAVGSLEALIEAGHTISLVVTQPDKKKGRGHAMQYPLVKEAAIAHKIPVWQPEKIREEASIEYLEKVPADVIVVVAFGQLIPKRILQMKPYGCINVHGSLLPKYRGAAPIQWAVIDGETESGVTTMQMDEGLDTGDMLLKTVVPLEAKETGGSLFDKLSAAGAALCVETLRQLQEGTIHPEKQGESPTPYASMLTKEMGEIDWTKDAISIERLVRGLNPWPSAYTTLDGKILKIWECEALPGDASKAACGEILDVTKDSMTIQTGNGILSIKSLQLSGKKRMDIASFLRGTPLKKGIILSTNKL